MKKPDRPERRKHPRHPVRYVPLSGPVPGEVLDMGPMGMRLEVNQALTPGQRYSFSIGTGAAKARLRGMVRWCRFVGSREQTVGEKVPVFVAGVVFLMLDDDPPASLLV